MDNRIETLLSLRGRWRTWSKVTVQHSMEMLRWTAKKDFPQTELLKAHFPLQFVCARLGPLGFIATDGEEKNWKAASWRAAAKGRRASLCIDADHEWVHGKESQWGERSEGLELLAGTECPTPSHHTPCPHHTLCSQDVELLFCTLRIGNEVASGEATMWSYVTSHFAIPSGNKRIFQSGMVDVVNTASVCFNYFLISPFFPNTSTDNSHHKTDWFEPSSHFSNANAVFVSFTSRLLWQKKKIVGSVITFQRCKILSYKPCSVLVSDKHWHALISYSSRTSWIIFHCLIGTFKQHNPTKQGAAVLLLFWLFWALKPGLWSAQVVAPLQLNAHIIYIKAVSCFSYIENAAWTGCVFSHSSHLLAGLCV